MSNRHFMFDIETLSTAPDAAIVAIGVAVFNRVEIIDHFEWLIDPAWAIGRRDQRTFDEFWNNREVVTDEVHERMMSGVYKPWEILESFNGFCDLYSNPEGVWANPPQFDLVIMRNLWETMDMVFPFHWTKERDFRTMRNLAGSLGVDYSAAYEGRKAHDAREDAIAQAKAVQIIWDRLYNDFRDRKPVK